MAQSVIERSLVGITGAIERTLFADEVARQPGLLQTLDPRVKLVSALAMLLALAFARNLWILVGLYVVVLLLAWRSNVPLRLFVRNVWLALPFFTGLVALPVIFNFVTPGTPLVVVSVDPYIAITLQGVRAAGFLILRVGTSVSLAVLLVLTTPWNTLLNALSVLKAPSVFLLMLGMTYRYIFLMLKTADDMFLARKSRVVGGLSGAAQRRVVTNTMGVMLGKSFDMSQEVYLAMLSRGYRGRPRTLDRFQMQPRDFMWLGIFLAAALAVFFLGSLP